MKILHVLLLAVCIFAFTSAIFCNAYASSSTAAYNPQQDVENYENSTGDKPKTTQQRCYDYCTGNCTTEGAKCETDCEKKCASKKTTQCMERCKKNKNPEVCEERCTMRRVHGKFRHPHVQK